MSLPLKASTLLLWTSFHGVYVPLLFILPTASAHHMKLSTLPTGVKPTFVCSNFSTIDG